MAIRRRVLVLFLGLLSALHAGCGGEGPSAPGGDEVLAAAAALSSGLGAACTAASQCLSGFCADGVCCDSACALGAADACSIAAGALVNGECAFDFDGDGLFETNDNCPWIYNPTQLDLDGDGVGDACEPVCLTIRRGTLGAVEDTHIAADKADKSYGSSTGVMLGKALPAQRQGLLRFDLSFIPTTAQVWSATVTLNGVTTTGPSMVRVHEVTRGWAESAVTWQSFQGAYAPTVLTSFPSGAPTATFDLTQNVADWVKHPSGNFGVLLEQDPPWQATFASSELASVANRPSLQVCFAASECGPDGSACDDGDPCTQMDRCQGGVCVGSNPVVCAASDQCHVAACNPATGACQSPPKPDGSPCDDGNGCSQTDTCQAGTCVGQNPVICTATDSCHQGTCDMTTGACSYPAKPDWTACDDGNACTQWDSCQTGVCVGSEPVVCAAADACHDVGTCDPATGACMGPAKPDGTPCNDNDACTQTDTCQQGVCTGANPVACAADACRVSSTCSSAAKWATALGLPANSIETGHEATLTLSPSGIAADTAGNVFATMHADSDVGGDTVLTKLDPQGNVVWSKSFGVVVPYQPWWPAIAMGFPNVDPQGNVVIAGFTRPGFANFGQGPDQYTVGIVLVKYSSAGALLWVKKFSGDAFIRGSGIDAAGNVVVGGSFMYAISPTTYPSAPIVSGGGTFIMKLDPAGNVVWAKQRTNPSLHHIAVAPSGESTIVYDDGVVERLDSAGTSISSLALPNGRVTLAAFGAMGDMALAGSYDGSTDLGAGPVQGPSPGSNTFVAKYGTTGALSWVKSYPSGSSWGISSVRVSAAGDVLLTGGLSGVVDFGQGAMHATNGGVILRLDRGAGAAVWSRAFDAASGDPPWQPDVLRCDFSCYAAYYGTFPPSTAGHAITTDDAGNVLLQASLFGKTSLGGPAIDGGLGFGVFVAKFAPDLSQCVGPAKPDGTACDDGSACTEGDTCQGGACVGASPVVCGASD